MVIFPGIKALGSHKMLRKNDLYHIDISPATKRAADSKILRIFNAYPPIPRYSCSLDSD